MTMFDDLPARRPAAEVSRDLSRLSSFRITHPRSLEDLYAQIRDFAHMQDLRSQPCPCRSGKQYRRCCYAHERNERSARLFVDLEAQSKLKGAPVEKEPVVSVLTSREDDKVFGLLDLLAPLLLRGPNPLMIQGIHSILSPHVQDKASSSSLSHALWALAAPRGASKSLSEAQTSQIDQTHVSYNVSQHVTRLYKMGLVSLPTWGQGKAMPGRDHQVLADLPPPLDQLLNEDYSGGLAILSGNKTPAGHYVLGIDLDHPEALRDLPEGLKAPTFRGAMYAETGTGPGKFHIFWETIEPLDGQINILTETGLLVAELKGRGITALRSWPTVPPEKVRGYEPYYWSTDPQSPPSRALHVQDLAESIRGWLQDLYGQPMVFTDRRRKAYVGAPVASKVLTAQEIEEVVAALGGQGSYLSKPDSQGNQYGQCPFHEPIRGHNQRSLSVNFQKGVWNCLSARCSAGGGQIHTLAQKLGLRVATPEPLRGPGGRKASYRLTPSDVSPDDLPDMPWDPEDLPEPLEAPARRAKEALVEDEGVLSLDPLSGVTDVPMPWVVRELQETKDGAGLAGSRHGENAARKKRAVVGVRPEDSLALVPDQSEAKNAEFFTTGDRSDKVGIFPPDWVATWEPLAPLMTPRHLYPQVYLPTKAHYLPILREALRRAGMKPDELERKVRDLELCGAVSNADICPDSHVNKKRRPYFCQLPFHDCAGRNSWRIGRICFKPEGRFVQHFFVVRESRVSEKENTGDIHERCLDAWSGLVGKAQNWKNTKGLVVARSVHANLGKEDSFLVLRLILREDEKGSLDKEVRRIKDALGKAFDLEEGNEGLHCWVETDQADDLVEWLMDMSNNHLLALRGEDKEVFRQWYMVTKGKHLFQSYGMIAQLIEEAAAEQEQEKEERPVEKCETCGKDCRAGLVKDEEDGRTTIIRRPSFISRWGKKDNQAQRAQTEGAEKARTARKSTFMDELDKAPLPF